MKILWKYLGKIKLLIFLSLLFATIAQLLALIDPIIFGKIIDDYTLNSATLTEDILVKNVLFLLSLAIIIALFGRLSKSIQEFIIRKAAAKFGMTIFNVGLKQLLRLRFQEFEENNSGESISILQKVKTDTERFVASFINVLFSSLVGFAFLSWYSVTKNWLLLPVFFVGLITLGSLTGALSKKIKTVQRSINRETNKLAGSITEGLRNIELVKSLGLTFQEIKRLETKTKEIYRLESIKARNMGLLTFLQGVALNVFKQSILFILLWLIFRKILSPGELIAMQFISSAIFIPLQELGNIIVQYREVDASIKSFDLLMNKPIEKRPENSIEIGDLEKICFSNVIFRHKTAIFNAIDDISFETKTGETIAFVGPSGSGKSTLVKLLLGLYEPISGKISFNDESSTEIRYNPLRRQMGLVSQSTQLFSGTIKENLLFVKPDASDEEILDSLNKASASSLIARAPKGIDTLIGENGMKLSGGEKQRISIAMALLRKPRALIFDEATSALDSLTEEDITKTMQSIAAKREQITILIAHRLSTIMYADRILVLEKGKIIEVGTHEELLKLKGLYYAMWRQQIGERA